MKAFGFLLALSITSSAVAQTDTATAVGTARDTQGGVVAGASLSLKNIDTGFARETTTGAEGRYRLSGLPLGRYELTAARAGFKTVVRSGITLTLGAEAVLDVELPIADIQETIAVTADVPIVETTTSAIEMKLNREQLDLLPIPDHDFTRVLRLTPASQAFGSSFTGSRERSNEFTLDGVDDTSDISGFLRMGPALESIQEVQVLGNNYKAEHGRASGGIINVATRAGANRWSGSGFLAVSDDALNAQSPYANRQIPEPPFRRLIFGGSSGGPVVRDRAHFFVAYESVNEDTQAAATQLMPSAGAPFSAATREFLASNGIPLSVFGTGGLVRQVRPEQFRLPRLTARIDGRINERQSVTGRYTYLRSAFEAGAGGTLFDYNGNNSLVTDHFVLMSHKWMASAARLNEAYVLVGQTVSDFGVNYPGLPNVTVTGAFTLGGNSQNPQGRSEPLYQLVDSHTFLHSSERWGEHTVKAGANFKIFRSSSFFDANWRGTFVFPSLQQFVLGQPSFFTQNRGDTSLDRHNTLTGFFVQDDWRLTSSLTVNAGLRYDYESAKTEALREVIGEPGPGISRDKNNVAPRIGVVWAPGGSTKHAVYGGAGIYYDQIVMNILGNVRFTPPKVIGIVLANPSFPDAASGILSVPAMPISTIDPDLTTPYNVNSSVGYRRELGRDLGLDVSFVYNRGWGQVMTVDRNAGAPGSANLLGQGASRPDSSIITNTYNANLGIIRYKGLLVDVRKRLSGWTQGGLAYTLSKTVDNSNNFASPIQVPTRPELNVGPSANDRRHELKGHIEANLPFDVQLAAIVEHYSEAPLNVITALDLNGDGITGDWVNESICRNIACPGLKYSRNSVRELSTDEANRLRSLFGLAPVAEFANNPKYLNLNLALHKWIRFGDRRARVTAEVMNTFNTPQRIIGSSSVTSAIFGAYTGVVQPRVVQLTVQFDW